MFKYFVAYTAYTDDLTITGNCQITRDKKIENCEDIHSIEND